MAKTFKNMQEYKEEYNVNSRLNDLEEFLNDGLSLNKNCSRHLQEGKRSNTGMIELLLPVFSLPKTVNSWIKDFYSLRGFNVKEGQEMIGVIKGKEAYSIQITENLPHYTINVTENPFLILN